MEHSKLSYYAVFENGVPTAFYHEGAHGPKFRARYVYTHSEDIRIFPTRSLEEEANPECGIPPEAVKITDAEWATFVGADQPHTP